MDADLLMQEIYKIARRLGGMKIFNHNFPINNTGSRDPLFRRS